MAWLLYKKRHNGNINRRFCNCFAGLSSAVILNDILVNASAITFRQSLGVVMGANIGTTFSSELIALDIGKWSPIPIVIGLILSFIVRDPRLSKPGKVLLFFGIMFFGLYTMERAVEPLRDHPEFLNWMSGLEDPVKGSGNWRTCYINHTILICNCRYGNYTCEESIDNPTRRNCGYAWGLVGNLFRYLACNEPLKQESSKNRLVSLIL